MGSLGLSQFGIVVGTTKRGEKRKYILNVFNCKIKIV